MARQDTVVLGINDGHTAGAALTRNGKVEAAVQEERLNNIKNYSGVPSLAIHEVYKISGIHPSQTTAIAIGTITRVHAPLKERPLKVRLFEGISPFVHSHLWSRFYVSVLHKFRRMDELNVVFRELGIDDKEVMFIEHHQAHAATAFYQRPWKDDTLVLTNDGAGDGLSSTVSIGRDYEMERIASSTYYDSIGNNLYSEITGYLGMKRWEHEYKIMGMAPYGRPEYCLDPMRRIIRINPKKPLEFQNTSGLYGIQLQNLLWHELGGQRFDNISAAVQQHFEDLLTQWVSNCVRSTGIRKIACSGGLFLNVKANKKLRELTDVDDIFFYPACDDGGIPVGAALEAYNRLCTREGYKPEIEPLQGLYYGTEYDNDDIKRRLNGLGLSHKPEFINDMEGTIADMLAKGKIIARFSGRVEWGPRALGNRSILADPRDLRVIRRINFAIKMRDFWMPFAPSTIEADSAKYFTNFRPARYMIEAFDTEESAAEIIAGLHPYDRSGRPQSVNELNPGYLRLLKEFKSATGVSGVLNTSFNLHGFPIVGKPEIALHTLKHSELDAVAIGNWLVNRCCV